MNPENVNWPAELEERLRFETLIADLSSKFVNLPASEVDREIEDALRRVCELLGVELAVLWQWSGASPDVIAPTHAYPPLKALQPPEPLRQEQFPWLRKQILAGRVAALSSLEEFPAEAAVDREFCRHYGVKSHLSLPLSVGGDRPVGLLGFNTLREERDWPDAVVKRLQLVAHIFTGALARKRADQALRESEERMTLAADAAQFGVWGWDIARNQVWGSDRWLRLFGFVTGEHISFEMVIQRIHPEDRQPVEREVRRALADGSDYAWEFRAVLPDGAQRWIMSRGRGYPDANGTLARMLGTAADITERKRTEEALRASEARLAAGTELAGLGYYEADYAERTCFLDDRFRQVCGVPTALGEGLDPVQFWSEHIHPEDRQLVQDERQKLHNGHVEQISLEYRYLHPALGLRWLHHSARVAERRAGGGGIRTFGVIRDITAQKQAEQEAHELRGKLAHAGRVTLLGQMASALAHELSQPLGAILRNAETAEIILQESSPDLEELRAIVTDILRDDQRAGHVIDRLRSLLKRRSLDPQPIELPSVIVEVLSLVRADAAARQVKLAYAAAPGLPLVLGDRIHLQQVLLNLLLNAMDALEACAPNQRTIQVSAQRADSDVVEVRVCDDGPGIAGDSPERLFEPFFTTKPNGMGMGLPVSRTIIEAHKGKLWAENRPQGGACFCFTLPVSGGNKQSVITLH